MSKILNQSIRFMKKNASTILTCIGGVGVVVTAVSAVKATPKALDLIEKSKRENGEDLTKFEVVKSAAPAYISTAIMGASTIACIVSANVINQRKQAALMSAYALLDTSYKEYKKKVTDLYGEDADKLIRKEMAKDHYGENDDDYDDGKQLFYESISKRYFRSTREDVLSVELELNRMIQEEGGLTLNVYFSLLGLKRTDYGDVIGWSNGFLMDAYWTSWVDFNYDNVVMDDGLECCIVTPSLEPCEDFDEY